MLPLRRHDMAHATQPKKSAVTCPAMLAAGRPGRSSSRSAVGAARSRASCTQLGKHGMHVGEQLVLPPHANRMAWSASAVPSAMTSSRSWPGTQYS